MKANKSFSKFMALALSIVLVLTMNTVVVSAETEGCIHEHNTECGYVEGTACSHTQHSEACSHRHDEDCGWDEETGIGCTHQHNEDCGYAEAAPCTHTQHDEACGYIEAAPCCHVCNESCGGLIDSGKTPGESGDTVIFAAFEPLAYEVAWRSYTVNMITEAELDLPAALTGTDADDNAVTIEGVTWKSYPAFDPAVVKGYVFSAALPQGYDLAAGVTAPQIWVFIQPEGGPEPQTTAVDEMFTVNGIGYKVLTEDTGTNTGTVSVIANSYTGSISIPDKVINGSITYTVTTIAASAFYGRTTLAAVSLPDGLTTIGDNAFTGCTSLTSITLPSSLTAINQYAFENCTGLTSVIISGTLDSIGNRAFQNCSALVSVTFLSATPPNTVGDYVFSGTSGLVITVPIGCKDVYQAKFIGITISDGTLDVGETFTMGDYEYKVLTKAVTTGTVEVLGYVAGNVLASLVIPDTVTHESIVYTVTEIGESAFSGKSVLKSVVLPDSITSIGERAFNACDNLTYIRFLGDTPPTIAATNSFNIIAMGVNFVVPEGKLSAYNIPAFTSNLPSGYTLRELATPSPGGSGTISANDVRRATLTLSWAAATDTTNANMIYYVYQSNSNDISTLTACNSKTPIDMLTGETTCNVTGLTANTTYWFNVVVENIDGNKAAYTAVTETTPVKDTVTITGLSVLNDTYNGNRHVGYTGTAVFTDLGSQTVTPTNTILTAKYNGTGSTSYGPDNTTPPTNAGTYNVTLSLEGDSDYKGTLDLDFSIGKKTLTWNNDGTVQSKSYDGGTSATVATQPTLNGVIEGDNVTATSGTVVYTSVNAGTSIGVTAAGYDINDTTGNYAALTSQPVFANGMISPMLITITPNAGQSKIYGANDSVSYTYTNTTLINGDTISGALSRESGEDVGTYTYTLGTLSAGSNYLLTVDETITYSITTATFNDTLPTVNRNVIIGDVRTITIPITELTPTPAIGKSLGTVSGYVLDSYNAGIVSTSAEISDGNLTITSKSNLAQANISETINVKVSTQNYGDITVTVTLQTVDKADVSNKIAFVEGSKSYTGSEQTYETATISDMEQGVNHQWIYTYAVAQDDSGNGSLGGTNKPLTAGTYTVTATYEDDINIGTATVTFTINKAVQTAPIAPVTDNITADMVTLKKPDGMTADAEYMQGPSGTWQTIADFSGLTPNTAYSFYMRLAETSNYKASPASPAISVTTEKAALTGTVTISGTAKFNQTLTAQTVSLTTDPAGAEKGTLSYQWKRSGTAIAGANNATYVIMGADIDKTITVTVTTLNCIGEVTSSATLVVGKADAPNITWPTANGVTYGQTLSDSTLSFTSNEYGTFAWTDSSISPVRNNSGYSVTFIPFNDTIANYETITPTTQNVAVDVAAKNVSSLTIEPIAAVTYNGTSHEPIPDQDIIVKDGNTTLTSATDYTVTYSDNIYAGTAIVTITGAGNYTGTKEAEFIIYKATPALLTWPAASDLTYGAALSMSNFTGGSATGTWAWTDSSIIPTVINSGYNVTFTPADTANYDWSGVTLTQAVNILVSKANGLTVSTEPAMNAREGIGPARNYSFDMNNITLNKGDTGVKTYSAVKDTDGNNILSNITVTNNILTYDIAGMAAVGDTATIAITIESDNYIDITAILTITVTVKDTQTIRFQEAALTKTYGDAKFTAAATLDGSGGTGTVTYTSDNTNVAMVNAATGEVTIVGVGSANITARKAEDADWFEATASYTLTVIKASQIAPGGIGKTDETNPGANNGTITNVTTSMEYRRSTDTVYTSIPGTTVTGLPPGTYYVRYAATANHNPGTDTVITIASYIAPVTEIPSSDSKGSIVENNHYGTSPEAPKFWSVVNTDIGKDISANTKGSNHNVVTGRNIVVPDFILETLQESNTTLAMHTGMGVTFSITGSDIPDHTNTDKTVNLTVRQGELSAPEALIREKTKDTIRSIEIPMESHESFGMTVNVHFSLGAENADNYANLYRYNEQTGAFEYLGSFQINEDGQAMFGITGGADFLLTVTAEKPDEVIVPMNKDTYTIKPGDTLSGTAVKYGMSVAQIMALNPEIKNSSRIRPGQKIRVR